MLSSVQPFDSVSCPLCLRNWMQSLAVAIWLQRMANITLQSNSQLAVDNGMAIIFDLFWQISNYFILPFLPLFIFLERRIFMRIELPRMIYLNISMFMTLFLFQLFLFIYCTLIRFGFITTVFLLHKWEQLIILKKASFSFTKKLYSAPTNILSTQHSICTLAPKTNSHYTILYTS